MIVVTWAALRTRSTIVYRPFFGVHASIADKGPILTLCDTKSRVHQS